MSQASIFMIWSIFVQIKDLGVKAGVVLNPATPIESIQHVITQVDLILLMSGKLLSLYFVNTKSAPWVASRGKLAKSPFPARL